MKRIYFITGNKGKVKEVQGKLKKTDIEIIQKDIGYPEIQADTLEEVVTNGLLHLQSRIDTPFIIEDAGIFIDALKGFPGVYSKFVYYSIGLDGILQLLKDETNRTSVFRSVYGLFSPDNDPQMFIGESFGTISEEKKGTQGFGYDPIFKPKGSGKTFAEMTIEEKNSYSHRGKALDKLLPHLENSL